MASLLTLNNSATTKDNLLLGLATACDNAGWQVKTHPSASMVNITSSPITAFFPGLYVFWTVKIGGMNPTVFIPDQASYDAFVAPPGYDKYMVGSYDANVAFLAAIGMAQPVAGVWAPQILGELTPDPGDAKKYLVGWVNPGNVIDAGTGFYELQNLPQTVFSADVTMGQALQTSFGIPRGGGYACQSVPLKFETTDPATNYFSLFFTTGIQNIEAFFASLFFYASHDNASGIHAFFDPPPDASNINVFATDVDFDLYVAPHALFYCKSPGAPGSGVDIYACSVLPIGDDTDTAFVCLAVPGGGFRYGLNAPTGLWLLLNGVIYDEFSILIPYLFTNAVTPHSAYWEADLGAVQNLEAFVLAVLGNRAVETYRMFGVLKDIVVGNGAYASEAYYDHDGRTYFTYTQGHDQAALLVKTEL